MSEFEREKRYVIIKLSHLNDDEIFGLNNWLDIHMVKPIDGLVVEDDWPEYEPVWKMIEDRVNGTIDDSVVEVTATDNKSSVWPKPKPIPAVYLASYHEAIGWNACIEAMREATRQEKEA